jgi:hypothetical protein
VYIGPGLFLTRAVPDSIDRQNGGPLDLAAQVPGDT